MADYMRDTGAVIQNLKDAGCNKAVVEEFLEFAKAGERQKQFTLLEKHRKSLLDKVHGKEKQIDCLDYLVFQMKKEEQNQEVKKERRRL